MRYLLALSALSLLVFARPGPNTTTHVSIAPPECKVAARMKPDACPAPVLLEIRHDLPDPGHSVKSAVAKVDREAKRIRVDIETRRKDGMWPQVIVPTKTTVDAGRLPKGRYLVEVRRDKRLLHAFVLDGR